MTKSHPIRHRNAQTDEIARVAAARFENGQAATIARAIQQAVDELGYVDVPRPGMGQVRRHAQAMKMQELGEHGYRQTVHEVWHKAEAIMTVLADFDPQLVGRAVSGHIDAGVTLHIRIYTRERIGDMAQMLVDFGYDEPSFATADSPHFGRFDRIIVDDDGLEIVLTRCVPEQRARIYKVNLFTKQPIESADLDTLRQRLASDHDAGHAQE